MSIINLIVPVGTSVATALILFLTSAFFKRSWYEKSVAKVSWLALCLIGAIFSMFVGSLSGVFAFKWDADYTMNQTIYSIYIIECITLCAYHAIVASWSDLIFRKVNRAMLVSHMVLQTIATTAVLLTVNNATFLLVPTFVGALLCWLSGLLPGGGMSDGRMFALYCLAMLPLFQTSLWIPVIAVLILAIIWSIIANIMAGKTNDVNKAKSILKTMFPVAPLLAPCMLLFAIIWPLTGHIIPFVFTTGVIG